MTDGDGVVLVGDRRAKVRTSLRLDQELLERAKASFEAQSDGFHDVTMTEVVTQGLILGMACDWKRRVETGGLKEGDSSSPKRLF